MTASDTARQRLEHQRRAFLADPARPLERRREDIRRIEAVVLDNQQAWVEAVSTDFGHRPAIETRLLELSVVARGCKAMRQQLRGWMKPTRVPTPLLAQPGRSYVRHDPKGVIGILSPWNYPVQLALLPLATALAAGNRAIIKPSELTPATNALMKRLLADAFPPDQVAVVEGGPDVAADFSSLPFDHIFFTGSTRVGRAVAAAAGQNLVPVTLELGGKSPVILDDRYPLDDAAGPIAWGRFLNAGQTCVAADHVLSIGDEAQARRVGQAIAAKAQAYYPDHARNLDYTAVIAGQHFDRLQSMVDEARARGVEVIQPEGEADASLAARKFPPTVVINPPADLRMMREEIFGPVLPIVPVRDLDGAVAHVNEGERPLALYVFSHDDRFVERVLDHTHSGGVTVNGTLLHLANDHLPFGGNGPSGHGAYHGRFGFDQLTHARAVFRTGRWHSTRLMAPPYGRRARQITDMALKL